ncbi:hypothetical protein M011DRAFT_496289 [Sporormia fimetaria CBS 119925]|uniref:Uncharacterized protein n=1 Tax=Sporormia fimetaria CBS 119925 TaxID=1340428 RepID=A0A6A6V5V8_9PLEO|nr:hypothetical protein M011DRAFT_496289 [Sporormia fimetaria CBS 119925]
MLSYHTVNRSELDSPASSPRSSPDPDLTERLRAQALHEFTFAAPATDEHENEQEEDDEAELVLFSAPVSAPPKSQKIRLQSPELSGEPGFLVKRPKSYYFAEEPNPELEGQYRAAAVDANAIRDMAMLPWPGCAVPWKVKTISAAGIKKCVLVGHPQQLVHVEEQERKRKRKGKKARIALRIKARAKAERSSAEEKLKKAKEAAEREKRTRRNREKKVKKKAKEKAKKEAAVDQPMQEEVVGGDQEQAGSAT